jgi:hypothetical protein
MARRSRSYSLETLAADQLRRRLSAGSSRVFDCERLHAAVLKDGGTPEQYLFQKQDLNRVIYIKEPLTDQSMIEEAEKPIGTKLYFAYNERDAYEGERSIFIGDRTLRTALHFHAGIDPDDSSDAFSRDMRVLRALEELPSLDPFLLKDRMQVEGIDVHEGYFEISEAEFARVRDFVMARFRPMIELAFQDMGQADTAVHLRTLVDKLWGAKDMDGLAPIVKAMQLNLEEAPSIFYAWKGVIYYDYLYSTQQDRWKDYAAFLGRDTVPTDVVPKSNRDDLAGLVMMVRSLYKQRWMRVRKILLDYNHAYDALFKKHKSPAPFIDFLRASPQHFFDLGDCISSIDHAVEVWNGFKQSRVLRRMKYQQLHALIGLTIRILE